MKINISRYLFNLIIASSLSMISLKAEENIQNSQPQSAGVPLYLQQKVKVNEDDFVQVKLPRKDSFESVEEALQTENSQKNTFIGSFFQNASQIVKSGTTYIYNFIVSFFR